MFCNPGGNKVQRLAEERVTVKGGKEMAKEKQLPDEFQGITESDSDFTHTVENDTINDEDSQQPGEGQPQGEEAEAGFKGEEDTPGEEDKGKGEEEDAGTISPEFMQNLKEVAPTLAEFIERKGIKDMNQISSMYEELEKTLTKTNQGKAKIEEYAEFDSEGNFVKLTDKGLKALSDSGALPKKDEPGQGKPEDGKSPVNVEEVNTEFFNQFEKSPVETLTRIISAVVGVHGKSIEEKLEKIKSDLQPFYRDQENKELMSLIDEVAEERVKAGDTVANKFIDKYNNEIIEELGKMDKDFVKSNRKQALKTAYLQVKDRKWHELQEKHKQETLKQRGDEAENAGIPGQSGGGGGDNPADEIFGTNQAPGSAFFE